MKRGQRIGIFGGTFDPIHYGHLRAAEEVRERFVPGAYREFGLDRVVFVPNRVPPHKSGLRPADGTSRLEMIRLAIRGNRRFEVSDFELSRPGKSFTVQTLDHFRRAHGGTAKLFFILGTDAFAEIAAWHRPDALFEKANFIVMTRPGVPFRPPSSVIPPSVARFGTVEVRANGRLVETYWDHPSGHSVRTASVSALDVSASDIRDRVARGLSIRYLTPDPVIRYIRERGLYR